MSDPSDAHQPFSEKAFYLAEFRGRTLGIVLPKITAEQFPALKAVLDEFAGNSTRVVLITPDAQGLARLGVLDVVSASDPRWVGALWRGLRSSGRALLHAEGPGLAETCSSVALRLGLAKLVWVQGDALLRRSDGSRLSFLDLAELDSLLTTAGTDEPLAQQPLLREIREMIAGGLHSVSICSAEALAGELFTYAGSGTFFTRERAPAVRSLVVDDFDAAQHLIGQGVREGYLVERSPVEIEDVLTNGIGVFIEGRYLAGIGALIPYASDNVSEISSLYTLTRFLGEGVGGHLLRFALQRARAQRQRFVFACTTSERVEGFFLRHGFERADPDIIPADKWKGYPPERRGQLRCLMHPLGS